MAVRVRFPHADRGHSYQVPENQLGHMAVCKRCRRAFTLKVSERERAAEALHLSTSNDPPPLVIAEVPEKLGRFEVRSRLDAGAFGAVYRGRLMMQQLGGPRAANRPKRPKGPLPRRWTRHLPGNRPRRMSPWITGTTPRRTNTEFPCPTWREQ